MVDGHLRRICRVLAQAETVAALRTLVLLLLLETMLLTVKVMFRDILLMLMLIFKEMLGLDRGTLCSIKNSPRGGGGRRFCQASLVSSSASLRP
jgi:hypothetical protein